MESGIPVFVASLSEAQAQKRLEMFSKSKENLSYDVFFKLPKGTEYSGRVTATLDLVKASPDLFFDAAVNKITGLVINGKLLESESGYSHLRKDRHLSIPEEHLKVGINTIEIHFEHRYSRDGNGLHSFVDTDSKQYLHTGAEPYFINKMLPVLDQPDLKATWTLTVEVPNEWKVVANERRDIEASEKANAAEGKDPELTTWVFHRSKRIPSYLFAFVAGPYVEIQAKVLHNNIPMSIFCRESVFKYMNEGQADEIFEITTVCMDFFEKFFGYPYPFTKYDQVYCGEFNSSAMENPGVVMHNDVFVFREQTTNQRRTLRAHITLHELAHMWFGNLVTMKWWNDLWLNESFAEIICHLAMAKTADKLTKVQLTDVWLDFFRSKWRGYKEDQDDTTHPIAGPVKNTEQAETIFDGITYSKGSAVLKQLLCLIGEENFSKAMTSYFKKYEWSNTVLSDFMEQVQAYYKPLDPSYPADLSKWREVWLETAGTNLIEPIFDPAIEDSKAKLLIRQTAVLSQYPVLRPHKLKIALFDEKGEICEVIDTIVRNQEETAIEYEGSKRPVAVLLNYQDESFVKVAIDKHSLEFFKGNLHKISDEFTRSMIWKALWDMTRDGVISSLEFIDIVSNSLFQETGDITLENIYIFSSSAIDSFTPSKARSFLKYKLFDLTYRLLKGTDPKANRVILLRERLIEYAQDERHLEILADWFNGKHESLSQHQLTKGNKWAIVKKIYTSKRLSQEAKREFLERIKQEDPSDLAKLMEKGIEGFSVPKDKRKVVFESFTVAGKDSVRLAGTFMRGFNSEVLAEENKELHDRFFEVLIQVFRENSPEYSREFFNALYPNGDELEKYLKLTENLLPKTDPEKDAWLNKALKTTINDLKRRLKCYNTFISYARDV